jgi:nicotinamide-nucleotide amidase
VDLRLTVREAPPDEAARLLELAATVLRPLLGTHCYGIDQADLAAIVLERLRTMGLTLAVAESCTGGLLGARLTAIPGSSDVFVGGITAYANETKRMLLGVPAAQLDEHGAASGTVALAMACGVRERLRTGAGIAVTGIAGPTGGTAEKPVGTVWVAAVARDLERAARLRLPGGREEVRYRSAQAALNLMRTLVSEP